ncbi:DUF4175 family protein [Paracoccus sp. Z330]|uniref:DUF4175 family protein n=1 Tax=Paracoccus onchidii TaxID=3017813 RepID=A0ABT4ZCA8_9RHOB|nr:DUF4175 family protein [Paracoccus onchidii]MDB6176777.1 DUF4175 family protein [Paracoccus onchidii]
MGKPHEFVDIPGAAHAVRLTRWAMVWERVAIAFWPLAALLAVCFAVFSLGLVTALPAAVLPWAAGGLLLSVVVAAVWGGFRYRPTDMAEATRRVDQGLTGRPLAALTDRAAIGGEGPLWQAHLAQMRERAALARAVSPNAELARRDPFGLRLVAALALAMALIFGGVSHVGQGLQAVAATMARPQANGTDIANGPSWEGWAQPPAYTRRPTIYLNALAESETLELPKGSSVSFRLYDEGRTMTQTIGPLTAEDAQAPEIRAEESGFIDLPGRRFEVEVLPDLAPVVVSTADPTRRADGRLVQPFEMLDDHGVDSGQARISLDLASVDRRFGLRIAPEPRDDVLLELPMPRGGDRREFSGQLVEDLSRHPWANLPVNISLRAEDGIGQTGQSEAVRTDLPGRRFFEPRAAALIEMRRDLLWSRQNAGRSAEILRAITWRPEGFIDQQLYSQLRGAVGMMEDDSFSRDERDALAEALWQAAVLLEDGGLADALAAMKQAQEKLSEAIRNGANPDEVQRLMDELRAATDAYTQMLAEQGQEDPAERFTRNQQQQQISGDQIQQMMDEIQRLMNEGRMAEAQQLLEQFNRMMENLQVTQGGGDGQQNGEGNQSMNQLADTLRDQQQLSDEAFRDMQRQFGQGQFQEPSENADDLARQQRELREELGQQRGLLPGQGSQQGDSAGQSLDEAGRAMEDAEQALREGNTSEALQRQADAIQAMRDGMRSLADMLGAREEGPEAQGQERAGQDQQQGQPGEGAQSAQQGSTRTGRALLDPLGRQTGGNGTQITTGDPLAEGEDPARRARDLLEEIRRRSGERDRPSDERAYLERLLDRF